MRFLVFIPCFTHGGAEKQAAILARHLKAIGHDVDVWGFPTLGSDSPLIEGLQEDGIRCRELPEWPRFDWDFTKRGRYLRYLIHRFYHWPRQLKTFEKTLPPASFDVVVPFTPMPCLVAVLLAGRIRSNKVIWNHRGGYDDAGYKYTKFLIKNIKRQNPVMIANSTAGAQFLADTFHMSPNQVSVLHNVFLPDESLNHLSSQRKYHYRVDLPLQLLHVANLFREKDIWTVLTAMKHLKIAGFLCHLHIAGFFPDSKDYETFKNRICSDGLDSMVTYHGAIGRQHLQVLLLKADIGLLSSRSEGSPNTVMEYMYAGLPVIGTDIPGIREVLGPRNTDCLFPYGNAESLAELIVKLGTDQDIRKKLGEANRFRILEEFTIEKIMPKWEEILGNDMVKTDQNCQ